MERQPISPLRRLSTMLLAFALVLGLSAVTGLSITTARAEGAQASADSQAKKASADSQAKAKAKGARAAADYVDSRFVGVGTAAISKQGYVLDDAGKPVYDEQTHEPKTKPLAGAKLQILDKETREVVYPKTTEFFVSTEKTLEIPLDAGSYLLHEIEAPEGYAAAPDVAFEVIEPVVSGPGTRPEYDGLQLINTPGGALVPAFCVQPQLPNPVNTGHPAKAVDLNDPEAVMSLLPYAPYTEAEDMLRAFRILAYYGAGNDAEGIVADYAAQWDAAYPSSQFDGDYIGREATMWAAHAISAYEWKGYHGAPRVNPPYYGSYLYTEPTPDGQLRPKAQFKGGHIEAGLVNKLIDYQWDDTKADPIPDDFHIALYRPVAGDVQTVLAGYWGTVTMVDPAVAIGTTASDPADGDSEIAVGESVQVKDVVAYQGLTPGMTYTLKGKLVVKEKDSATGSPVPGAVLDEKSVDFAPERADGSVELTFSVDTRKLAGKELVAFERVLLGEVDVAAHEDIADASQTVKVEVLSPEIRTTASNAEDESKMVAGATAVKVKDVVSYTNLKVGKEYTLTGQLVTKSSGGERVVDEKSVTFTPEERNGEAGVVFEFRTDGLAGESLVAFETLSLDGVEVASHKNLDDAAQTVTVDDTPRIETAAMDDETRGSLGRAREDATVMDLVFCFNLKPGKQYTVDGKLVRKSDGALLSTGQATFVASESAWNLVTVSYDFDASKLAGDATVSFEYLSLDGTQIAAHEDLDNDAQTVYYPALATTATDKADGDHAVAPKGTATIVDAVHYSNVRQEGEYSVHGVLMKADGTPLLVDGKPVEATADFTTGEGETEGTVELEFAFPAEKLAGQKLVVFEELFWFGELAAEHKDLEDENQTVVVDEIPQIGTVATDKADGDKTVEIGAVTVQDTVSYRNLKPGTRYTLTGSLVTKSSSGQQVVAEALRSFTPETADGEVSLDFEVDTSRLAGEELVAFETLSLEGTVVATHADINDAKQTVSVEKAPEIATMATDATDGDKVIDGGLAVRVNDLVSYRNLKPGKEYALAGQLVTKSSGGQKVVAEASATFTPEKADGEVEMTFVALVDGLAGEELVVFETLSLDGTVVATHADINDAKQTVSVDDAPQIGTLIRDMETGDRVGLARTDATVRDFVIYLNARPGKEYTVRGYLVKASDGQPLVIDGKPVEDSITFTASDAGWGEVPLDFTFDASGLAGETVVAFEHLYYEGVEVASHTDPEALSQTLRFPKVRTTATDKADGDHAVDPEGTATVVDQVAYENLLVGKAYTFTGTLMRKSDGTPVLGADGAPVTASQSFIAQEPDGIVELEFSFDAAALAGDTVVAFERVTFDGVDVSDVPVAIHENLEDAEQSVAVDEIPEPVSVTVDKTWLNAETWEQPSPLEWPRGVTVSAKVMNGTEVVAEVTLDAEHPSATVAGLPALREGEYTVEEAQIEGIYALDEGTTVEKDEAGNVTAHLVNRLAWVRSERFLDFAKVDEKGEPVKGAVLEVTGTVEYDGSAFPAVEWTTDGSLFRIPDMVAGTYTLTEKQAPEGYQLADPIDFVIDQSGTVLIGGEPLLPGEGAAELALTMVDKLKPDDVPTPPEPSDSPSPSSAPSAMPSPSSPVTPGQAVQPSASGAASASSVPTTTRALSRTGVAAGLAALAMVALIGAGLLVRRYVN